MTRGSYDFEAFDWTKAICCGLLWGPPGARSWEFVHDNARSVAKRRPLEVVRDTLKLMAHLAREGACSEWWAHNGGRYDTSLILEGCIALGWHVSGAVAGGRVVLLTIKPPSAPKFELKDSQAVVNSSLRDAAEDFELRTKKRFQKADYKDPRAMLKLSADALEAGCRDDCKVVLELLERVESQLESWGGALRLTFASSAFTVLKAHAPPLPDLRHCPGLNELARVAYIGGRVEVFDHAPKGELCELDVTSSYPWSMAGALPFQPLGAATPKQLKAMLRDEGDVDGLVRATVTVPKCHIPALPWCHPDGGIYFPTGTWTAWFQAEELRYALALGYAVKAHEGSAYTKEAPFTEYITKVFNAKAKAHGAQRAYLKALANSSYGKFGQHPERENLMVFPSEDEGAAYIANAPDDTVRVLTSGKWAQHDAAEGDLRFLARSVYRWPAHTHYALAGAVTAKSRVLLHRALSLAVRPAYCDTDSVHCARASMRTLRPMMGEHLGGLKVELERMTARFYAPKLYELHHDEGSTYASKGFEVKASVFRQVVRGDVVNRERPRLLRRQLRKGGAAGVEDMPRSWSGLSYKRRPTDSGTVPWTVTELETNQHLEAVSPLGLKARKRWLDRQG